MVMTDVAHNCAEIEANGCGIIVGYDIPEITQAILSLVGSPERAEEFANRALNYVRQFHWERIFSASLERVLTERNPMMSH